MSFEKIKTVGDESYRIQQVFVVLTNLKLEFKIAFPSNLFLKITVSNVASEFFHYFHHKIDILVADLEPVTKVNRTIREE